MQRAIDDGTLVSTFKNGREYLGYGYSTEDHTLATENKVHVDKDAVLTLRLLHCSMLSFPSAH